jgi:hypothetical protein
MPVLTSCPSQEYLESCDQLSRHLSSSLLTALYRFSGTGCPAYKDAAVTALHLESKLSLEVVLSHFFGLRAIDSKEITDADVESVHESGVSPALSAQVRPPP